MSFLGPYLSLSHACSFGSTKLLDWIWDSSGTSFISSLIIVVGRKDLAIVEWLFSHFSDFEVPVFVVAASAGSLPILQFFMTNDASRDERDVKGQKKRKVEANDGEIKAEKQKPSTAGSHVVHWGVDVMMVAIETGDPEVVQWLHENTPHGEMNGMLTE
ncbi:hypothetical protein F443_05101 [Phytophthora nicotianae P1569]|uniref:Uncharacterized protein n=2 Tax=Phytophthora nicotianae TaxID=4792 RepID=V9FJF5_PHYNI|nr:hypothetical protein F443_05101 [Phytophthora nicotianae P1569]